MDQERIREVIEDHIEDALHRKRIKEGVGLVKEAEMRQHSLDRVKERIDAMDEEGALSTPEVSNIKNNIVRLQIVDFPEDKSYAVQLGTFKPRRNSKYFFDVKSRGYYKIIDDEIISDSTGDQIWAIVRENEVITIMLRKAYQVDNPQENNSKLNVDETVYQDEMIDMFKKQQS